MKIFLVQSYLGGKEPLVFPLGLSCLKACISGHEVFGFDLNTTTNPFEKLKETLDKFQPDVVGISLRNIDSTNKKIITFYYPYLKQTMDVIKTSCNALTVLGGPGFSMFAEEIMKDEPRIDYGVYLEGEETFPELIENLHQPEKVKSVYFRKNGQIIFSGSRSKTLQFIKPDRKLFPSEDYLNMTNAIGVETKRGCMLECVYCVYGYLNGKKYRLKDSEFVADEVESMINAFGIEEFTFVDSVFNVPLDHAVDVCQKFIDRKMKTKWSAWFNERYITQAFIELAEKAGCNHVILSPDGFSDQTLKTLGKNLRSSDIWRVLNILSKFPHIEISYNFFKNPPGQNFRNFLSILVFTLYAKLRLKGRVHFEFNSIRIEPHTRLHRLALRQGVVNLDETLLFPKYYTNDKSRYSDRFFDQLLDFKERVKKNP